MQILLNSNHSLTGDVRTTQWVEDQIHGSLDRFEDLLTRIEVHMQDTNSRAKGGEDDMRVALEARVRGLDPIAVQNFAPTLQEALSGAIDKLEKALDRRIGKLEDRESDPAPLGKTAH